MTPASRVSTMIKEIIGEDLIQEVPYPIVAPGNLEVLPRIFSVARSEGFKVFCHGAGSSFPPDFSLLRDNVIAITTSRLSGVLQTSPFSFKVLAGTPVSKVIQPVHGYARRTIGSLIASADFSVEDSILRILWPKVLRLEIVTAQGEFRNFSALSNVCPENPNMASWFLGSTGRLGMITAVEMLAPIPIRHNALDIDSIKRSNKSNLNFVLKREEIEVLLDPEGLFKWW